MSNLKITYDSGRGTMVGEIMRIECTTLKALAPSEAEDASIEIGFVARSFHQSTELYGLLGYQLVQWVCGICAVASAESWEELVGKEVVVLREQTRGRIKGITSLSAAGDAFWFEDTQS